MECGQTIKNPWFACIALVTEAEMLNTIPQEPYSLSFYEQKPGTTSSKGVLLQALYRVHWSISFSIKWSIKGIKKSPICWCEHTWVFLQHLQLYATGLQLS
jgi:hypothetical protein